MRELEKVLDKNEKVLWEGIPHFWPFFLGRTIPITIVGIFFLTFTLGFSAAWVATDGPFKYFIFAMPHLWVGLGLVFGPSIYNYLVFKHVYYAITDKRVILQKGVIGRDFDIVDFDKITDAQVTVGLLDKVFGGGDSGTISISTPTAVMQTKAGPQPRPYQIHSISKPYEIFKLFKQVSHDVKTDINYPNKLRPSENSGYNTEYKPK